MRAIFEIMTPFLFQLKCNVDKVYEKVFNFFVKLFCKNVDHEFQNGNIVEIFFFDVYYW